MTEFREADRRLKAEKIGQNGATETAFLLTTRRYGRTLRWYRTAGSTNDLVREAARNGAPDGYTAVAEEQTAGRGRFGRSFCSPAGTGVYFSILLRPEIPPAELPLLTVAAAVAAAEAIEAVTGKNVAIKWVNDLILDGKKVCGILAESAGSPDSAAVILGIGINLTADSLPQTLREIAGGIADGEPLPSRPALIAELLNRLEVLLDDPSPERILPPYRERSCLIGRETTLFRGNETVRGTVRGIDDRGRLILEREDGTTEHYCSGEVTTHPAGAEWIQK